MVKFIATDLDGTLLDTERALPEEIFPIIEELYTRGVYFAPASGRQYANLKQLFAPVWEKLIFICENGALVKYRDETIYLNPVSDSHVKSALDEVRALPHVYPMLCGAEFAYIENAEKPFSECAFHAYTNCRLVPDLDSVIGKEHICKIAVYDEIAAADNCFLHLPEKLPHLRTILSGYEWCDVSSPTSSKGEAMKFIREKFGWKKEECVAFGDHMNDLEMLLECGTAYVTENAYPPLKEKIGNVIPSNQEGGVIQTLKTIIKNISVGNV